MNSIRTLCLSTLALPVLCATLAPADKVAFHPSAGSSISRLWSVKSDMSLEDMQMTMNGKPMPIQIQMDMEMTNETEVGVTDKFVALREGAPKEMLRSYDKLGSSGSFSMKIANMPEGDKERTVAAESELQGKTVKFLWNEEEQKYDLSFHESDADIALLENLDEDMDVRGVLPGKEVAEGDTWEIDVKSLRWLLMPGGNLKLKPTSSGESGEEMMPGMDDMGDLSEMVGDLLEGKATAEYKGIQEIDGGKYGVIHLTVKIASSNDMTETVQSKLKDLPEQVESMTIESMDVALSSESEGTVLWNLASGHVHSIDMSGKMKMDMDIAMKLGVQGTEMALEQQMSLSGTVAVKLTVTDN